MTVPRPKNGPWPRRVARYTAYGGAGFGWKSEKIQGFSIGCCAGIGRCRQAGEGRRPSSKTNGNGKVQALQVPARIAVRVVLEVQEGTPSFYSNYMEVSQTKWDFSLIFATLPPKPSAAKIAEMQATGILACPAEVTINFPTTLMAGLIRALITQKEAYEKENGVELKETGNELGSSKKQRRR